MPMPGPIICSRYVSKCATCKLPVWSCFSPVLDVLSTVSRATRFSLNRNGIAAVDAREDRTTPVSSQNNRSFRQNRQETGSRRTTHRASELPLRPALQHPLEGEIGTLHAAGGAALDRSVDRPAEEERHAE